ncbi:response regulator [Fulvivirga maritima]|uniref:response regulator n=1 Tax=Fulvivirga maritima TaxID=2904247 RepID=UPI001F22011C|nr:response regulator [Fulvivirga maritima]UII26821.1 response regulator [Fulvivirga maritima]
MSKTVLIVDDSESIRDLVEMTLENAGYKVIKSFDGEDATYKLNGRPVDLIITDLNMPNLDGIDFIKKVRAHEAYSTVPILLLTTESQTIKKEKAKEVGATGWIVKPFVQEKLIAIVKKVIR